MGQRSIVNIIFCQVAGVQQHECGVNHVILRNKQAENNLNIHLLTNIHYYTCHLCKQNAYLKIYYNTLNW